MQAGGDGVRPVPLALRDRAQRRLIRRVIERLAEGAGHQHSFGRLVRVAHTTALTALPVDADGVLAERTLLRACQARLAAEQTTIPLRAAA